MTKKLLKWLFKLGLTVLAFYLLSKKIVWADVKDIILQASIPYLLLALLLYIASKLVSAYRLTKLFQQIPVPINNKANTKLYFIGMFYNLFLPGGIGGDGYKAIWIKKNYDVKTKPVIAALFLDRFFGLAALFLLLFTGSFFTNLFVGLPKWAKPTTIALLILVLPVTYLICKLLFSQFLKPFFTFIGLSLIVQILQVLEAIVIIYAIGLKGEIINYLVLFLASSIAAVLPISVGGVGVRELVFVYGNELLSIEQNQAVAFSLIFFVITAISSLFGAFLSMDGIKKR